MLVAVKQVLDYMEALNDTVVESHLTLIHHQFCPNLAFTNHTPYEGMRVSAIFTQKNKKSL